MTTVVDRISELLSQLQSPDFYEREEAVRELSGYGEDEAVAGLVVAIEDPDLGIRELAAQHLTDMKGELACRLLIRFLGHDDIGTRNLAAEILVRIGEDAVTPLTEEYRNSDPDVRKFVADVLGMIKNPRAVKALSAMLDDANANVVCSAAEALGEIGNPEAVPALEAALDRCEDARLQLIEALGKCGDEGTLEHLYGHLQTDDPMTLFAALEAVGQVGNVAAIERLMPFLDDADRTIAETAMMSVINIALANRGRVDYDLPLDRFTNFLFDGIRAGNSRITDFTLSRLKHWYGRDVLNSLVDVLPVVGESDRRRIVEILEEAGPVAAGCLLDKFESSDDDSRVVILDILRQSIDPEIARELVKYVGVENPRIRQRLAHTLGISGWDGAIDCLRRMTRDEDGHVRGAAYAALGWLCREEDVEFLFEGLADPYPDVREAAMGALIVGGGAKAVERFTEDLYGSGLERQRLAVKALGLIGDAAVLEPLSKALDHPDATVRKQAIHSLGRIGRVVDEKPLLVSLSDEDSSVRKAAVSALIAIKGPTAVPEIRFMLDDDDIWVRYHAVNCIGELGQRGHADLIAPLLTAAEDILRIAALKALATMSATEYLSQMQAMTRDKNKDVAHSAEMALAELGGR